MSDLLFETPWWLPTTIAAVGAVLFYTANKRREAKLRTIGLGVLCLGVLVALVSYFVDTPKERAVNGSRRLVQSVADRDWTTMQSLLHPKASVSIANVPSTLYNDREQIVARAREGVERYGLKSVTVLSTDARQDQTLITVSVTLLSVQEYTLGRPIRSTWEFDWLESADGWSLYKIRAIEIGNQQTDKIESMFPQRK
jgi:hypothetical protein